MIYKLNTKFKKTEKLVSAYFYLLHNYVVIVYISRLYLKLWIMKIIIYRT